MKKLTRYNVNMGLDGNTIRLRNEPHEDGAWVPSTRVAELEVELDKVQARLDLQRQTDTAAMQFLKEVYEDRNVWGYERHQDWLDRVGRLLKRYDDSLPEDRTPLTMLMNAEKELEAARFEISKLQQSEASLQNQLTAAHRAITGFRKKNNELSTSLDETMTSLGKAYQEVEKWKEEYRVTEKARASFEKVAKVNRRENDQLKLNQSQAIYGEQIKSGEYLSRQLRGLKTMCLLAEGRSTILTADELDAYNPVASLKEKVEKIKELEERLEAVRDDRDEADEHVTDTHERLEELQERLKKVETDAMDRLEKKDEELKNVYHFVRTSRAHKILERVKEALETRGYVDLMQGLGINAYFNDAPCDPEYACATHGRCWPHSSTEEYHQLEKVWKTLEGIPGPFLAAWSVCRLKNVEDFAKAVLKYRKAKEQE